MRLLFVVVFVLACSAIHAQNRHYTAAENAHSHNDYRRKIPFETAYSNGFLSFEADIFLVNGTLRVSHLPLFLKHKRAFEKSYLLPISAIVKSQKGITITLLVELKTDYKQTLPALLNLLSTYEPLLWRQESPQGIKIVLTGKIPPKEQFSQYPAFVFFDGSGTATYTASQSEKIGMISCKFNDYSQLAIPAAKADSIHVPFRCWGAPDNPRAWKKLAAAGVTLINTDKPAKLANFFNQNNPQSFQQSPLK